MNGAKRISFPTPETMTEAQLEVYEQIVSGPRRTLVGPLRAALHNPVLADRWQRLGQVLRFETSIPTHLNELAILVTARRWNSELEWAIHAGDADRAGLSSEIAAAIRTCSLPDFGEDDAAREIYEFSRQVLQQGDIEDDVYQAIVVRWGEVGAVELTAVIGYYSMVAMTLNVHRIPLPDGVTASLPGSPMTLAQMPAADTAV
ncbi:MULTISPECIES: carboxymuconolactone decarboxylase family protein [Halomonadaceae]|jgi:4-carboxymuconolactone decarboxylase|uniref:carboxymuconolactone decarboxylase family protein n=1 Tax=Halomonadaceae TaxID=28256 RepID=UPI0012F1FE2E|nr:MULTISPECIES: carboxymuconolactone decarboxylase family protein [Halomonas]QNU64308.1 carboxymuconolactone decarboxylase family protein [Halomonas titanicae]CAD5258803.1 Carboxymuconolactone decarboxylase [Halomonas sp. 59]CAD5259043.1 Carboxymuconolactone decarboxylase [Halomonas sp. 113]CAD5272964.1 Carboxymuconolactone decarboxylase [Halomonas sp. I3]CAD5289644.1 Carboxymuconolactone decarboxylase [Halomonas sp. 156]